MHLPVACATFFGTVVAVALFASPVPDLPELEETRALVERVAADDDAQRLHGESLDRAQHALVSAERLYADGQPAALILRQLALARSDAEIASAAAVAYRRNLQSGIAVAGIPSGEAPGVVDIYPAVPAGSPEGRPIRHAALEATIFSRL